MIDELPPELQALIAAERAVAPSHAVRASVRARVAVTAGKVGLGASAALKLLSIIAIVGTGAGIATVARSSAPLHLERPDGASSDHALEREIEPRVELAMFEPPHARRRDPIEPRVRPVAVVSPLPAEPSEGVLLGRAWRAFDRGDGDGALALVEHHRMAHPRGALCEEREALHPQILARLGRLDEARALARRFLIDHPLSVHRSLIQTLEETPR